MNENSSSHDCGLNATKGPKTAYGSDSEVRLMLGAREGDASAFEEIVRRYRPRVYRRLVRITGDRHEAEDLTQEAFLRVYRYRQHYRPTAPFAAWLNRIVTNIGRNALRSRSRRAAFLLSASSQIDRIAPGSRNETPSETLLRRELRAQV